MTHITPPAPFPSPQLPSQITWGDCETKGTLPGEVAGWLAGLLNLTKGEWVLVLSDERWLAAQLTIRGPLPLNVVWGCTDGTPGTRERLQVLCEDLKSAMVVLARQTKPRYGQPEARHPDGGGGLQSGERTPPPSYLDQYSPPSHGMQVQWETPPTSGVGGAQLICACAGIGVDARECVRQFLPPLGMLRASGLRLSRWTAGCAATASWT